MKSRSSIELVHLFQMHVDDYRKDINMGLIQQIVGRHSQQQIMKLTQTYLTLNLKDIAVRAKIDSETLAEKNIFQLVCARACLRDDLSDVCVYLTYFIIFLFLL